jgi:hypothetical protein
MVCVATSLYVQSKTLNMYPSKVHVTCKPNSGLYRARTGYPSLVSLVRPATGKFLRRQPKKEIGFPFLATHPFVRRKTIHSAAIYQLRCVIYATQTNVRTRASRLS